MGKIIDLTGQTFERLTVKRMIGINKHRCVVWECECVCGKVIPASSNSLLSGHTKSCGCLGKENRIKANLKHGHARRGAISKEFHAWRDAKERCYNPNHPSYPNYGGRGITMCDRWKDSFESFLEDVGTIPPGLTLERKDNDGNYDPTNWKFAPMSEQNRNQRRNVWHECDGIRMVQKDWERRLGVGNSFIPSRLKAGIGFPEIVRQAKEYRLVKHWHEDLMEDAA